MFQPSATVSIAERAAAWSARLRAGDMGRTEQQEFEAWLADDPAHRKEFEQIEALWGEMEPLRSHGMVAAELRQRTPRRRFSVVPRYAFASLLAAATGWLFWLQAYPERTVQTAQAELKSITLADASKIELDADTALTLRETPFFTEVRIEHGSAFFLLEIVRIKIRKSGHCIDLPCFRIDDDPACLVACVHIVHLMKLVSKEALHSRLNGEYHVSFAG